MLIASKSFSAGSLIRYEVDYQYWLDDGRTLKATGYAVTVLPNSFGAIPTDVVISNISVTSDRLYFFITGTIVNEAFTVQVQVTDTLNEVVVDTIAFTILPP